MVLGVNKIEIWEVVEVFFLVNVLDVWISIVCGKIKCIGWSFGKWVNWKKVIVKFCDG